MRRLGWLRSLLALMVVLGSRPCFASGADLAGSWAGEWVKRGDSIAVTMSFRRLGQGWAGEFGSGVLQATGIPLTSVRVSGHRVHFEVHGDSSSTAFDGTIEHGRLAGTFIEGDVPGQFRFARIKHPPPALHSEEVKFGNGTVVLAGTLLLPRRHGRAPAVLFLHGSGPEERSANRWLAEEFVRSGFAALIYDKRGVGGSTGDWRTAGFDALAGDGAAGVRYLRTLPAIDPRKIGIYGHSQGGSVAPLVDADAGGLAFVIASSAPGLRPADVERYSVENAIAADSLPQDERADAKRYVSAIVDVAYRQAPRTELEGLAERFKHRSWFFAPPSSGDSYWTLSRAIASFDPSAAWARVKAPVLLVYGGQDRRVPPLASLQAIAAALREGGNPKVSTKVYAEADHVFSLTGSGDGKGWPKHEPDYAARLIAWAKAILRAR